jgi:phosphatidylethanolamine-binding protein (PEBP) family uncharacterized protein
VTEKRIPTASVKTFRPPLSWSSQPEGTKSFALTMVDPEARGGQGFVHWVAYGIPVSVTGFAEGETSKRPTNMSAAKAAPASELIRVRAPCEARRIIILSC